MGRRLAVALATACLGVALLGGAQAAAGPDAEGMVLGLSDFPLGATLTSEESAPLPYFPHVPYRSAFTRSLSTVIVDHVRIASLESSVIEMGSPTAASPFMRTLEAGASSTLARAAVLAIFRRAITVELEAANVKIRASGLLRARELGAGRAAVEYVFFVTTSAASIEVGEIYVQEKDALGLVYYVAGEPGVPEAEDLSLARVLAAHVDEASQPPPVDSVAPSITGTLQPGEVLTAATGTWSGVAPTTTYTYQWYLCTAAGQGCAAIDGATAATYTATVTDAGQALTVSVTATTPAGSATAMSPATGVITP